MLNKHLALHSSKGAPEDGRHGRPCPCHTRIACAADALQHQAAFWHTGKVHYKQEHFWALEKQQLVTVHI